MTTRTDYRDAIGWLYAHHRGDWDARNSLAMVTDPAGLTEALTALLLGLAKISTHGDVPAYLDHLRDNIEGYLDDAGIKDTE